MMIYSFDANAFITSWRYLPQETFSDFWLALADLIHEGRVRVAPKVYEEVLGARKEDPLRIWISEYSDELLYAYDEPLQKSVQEVMRAFPAMINVDMRKHEGDPWAVALAHACGGGVVTFEKASGEGARIPKIPNVCSSLGIPCYGVYDLFELEGWRWELHR